MGVGKWTDGMVVLLLLLSCSLCVVSCLEHNSCVTYRVGDTMKYNFQTKFRASNGASGSIRGEMNLNVQRGTQADGWDIELVVKNCEANSTNEGSMVLQSMIRDMEKSPAHFQVMVDGSVNMMNPKHKQSQPTEAEQYAEEATLSLAYMFRFRCPSLGSRVTAVEYENGDELSSAYSSSTDGTTITKIYSGEGSPTESSVEVKGYNHGRRTVKGKAVLVLRREKARSYPDTITETKETTIHYDVGVGHALLRSGFREGRVQSTSVTVSAKSKISFNGLEKTEPGMNKMRPSNRWYKSATTPHESSFLELSSGTETALDEKASTVKKFSKRVEGLVSFMEGSKDIEEAFRSIQVAVNKALSTADAVANSENIEKSQLESLTTTIVDSIFTADFAPESNYGQTLSILNNIVRTVAGSSPDDFKLMTDNRNTVRQKERDCDTIHLYMNQLNPTQKSQTESLFGSIAEHITLLTDAVDEVGVLIESLQMLSPDVDDPKDKRKNVIRKWTRSLMADVKGNKKRGAVGCTACWTLSEELQVVKKRLIRLRSTVKSFVADSATFPDKVDALMKENAESLSIDFVEWTWEKGFGDPKVLEIKLSAGIEATLYDSPSDEIAESSDNSSGTKQNNEVQDIKLEEKPSLLKTLSGELTKWASTRGKDVATAQNREKFWNEPQPIHRQHPVVMDGVFGPDLPMTAPYWQYDSRYSYGMQAPVWTFLQSEENISAKDSGRNAQCQMNQFVALDMSAFGKSLRVFGLSIDPTLSRDGIGDVSPSIEIMGIQIPLEFDPAKLFRKVVLSISRHIVKKLCGDQIPYILVKKIGSALRSPEQPFFAFLDPDTGLAKRLGKFSLLLDRLSSIGIADPKFKESVEVLQTVMEHLKSLSTTFMGTPSELETPTFAMKTAAGHTEDPTKNQATKDEIHVDNPNGIANAGNEEKHHLVPVNEEPLDQFTTDKRAQPRKEKRAARRAARAAAKDSTMNEPNSNDVSSSKDEQLLASVQNRLQHVLKHLQKFSFKKKRNKLEISFLQEGMDLSMHSFMHGTDIDAMIEQVHSAKTVLLEVFGLKENENKLRELLKDGANGPAAIEMMTETILSFVALLKSVDHFFEAFSNVSILKHYLQNGEILHLSENLGMVAGNASVLAEHISHTESLSDLGPLMNDARTTLMRADQLVDCTIGFSQRIMALVAKVMSSRVVGPQDMKMLLDGITSDKCVQDESGTTKLLSMVQGSNGSSLKRMVAFVTEMGPFVEGVTNMATVADQLISVIAQAQSGVVEDKRGIVSAVDDSIRKFSGLVKACIKNLEGAGEDKSSSAVSAMRFIKKVLGTAKKITGMIRVIAGSDLEEKVRSKEERADRGGAARERVSVEPSQKDESDDGDQKEDSGGSIGRDGPLSMPETVLVCRGGILPIKESVRSHPLFVEEEYPLYRATFVQVMFGIVVTLVIDVTAHFVLELETGVCQPSPEMTYYALAPVMSVSVETGIKAGVGVPSLMAGMGLTLVVVDLAIPVQADISIESKALAVSVNPVLEALAGRIYFFFEIIGMYFELPLFSWEGFKRRLPRLCFAPHKDRFDVCPSKGELMFDPKEVKALRSRPEFRGRCFPCRYVSKGCGSWSCETPLRRYQAIAGTPNMRFLLDMWLEVSKITGKCDKGEKGGQRKDIFVLQVCDEAFETTPVSASYQATLGIRWTDASRPDSWFHVHLKNNEKLASEEDVDEVDATSEKPGKRPNQKEQADTRNVHWESIHIGGFYDASWDVGPPGTTGVTPPIQSEFDNMVELFSATQQPNKRSERSPRTENTLTLIPQAALERDAITNDWIVGEAECVDSNRDINKRIWKEGCALKGPSTQQCYQCTLTRFEGRGAKDTGGRKQFVCPRLGARLLGVISPESAVDAATGKLVDADSSKLQHSLDFAAQLCLSKPSMESSVDKVIWDIKKSGKVASVLVCDEEVTDAGDLKGVLSVYAEEPMYWRYTIAGASGPNAMCGLEAITNIRGPDTPSRDRAVALLSDAFVEEKHMYRLAMTACVPNARIEAEEHPEFGGFAALFKDNPALRNLAALVDPSNKYVDYTFSGQCMWCTQKRNNALDCSVGKEAEKTRDLVYSFSEDAPEADKNGKGMDKILDHILSMIAQKVSDNGQILGRWAACDEMVWSNAAAEKVLIGGLMCNRRALKRVCYRYAFPYSMLLDASNESLDVTSETFSRDVLISPQLQPGDQGPNDKYLYLFDMSIARAVYSGGAFAKDTDDSRFRLKECPVAPAGIKGT